jgi:hypothetical protein
MLTLNGKNKRHDGGGVKPRQPTTKGNTMSKFKRDIMIIPNKLYGELVVNCYVSGGLAIVKVVNRWDIHHHASGTPIFVNLSRPTLIEAKAIANRLLDLPIDWEKPGADLMKAVREHADAIREIAK